jgi:hypothetical protein
MAAITALRAHLLAAIGLTPAKKAELPATACIMNLKARKMD